MDNYKDNRHDRRISPGQPKSSNRNAASPEVIGFPFHNPYTFIPFPVKGAERANPTPLTIDEVEKDRLTGFLDLEVKTCSPLLSSLPVKDRDKQGNIPPLPALKIGKDVIVPATGVRGTIRSLMTIISGSALDYIDEHLWLCQGRDTKLGGKNAKLYLAKVCDAKKGTVRYGEARLVNTMELFRVINDQTIPNYHDAYKKAKEILRQSGNDKKEKEVWIDSPANPGSWRSSCDEQHPWRVKVSGKKVNSKTNQHEGAFRPETGETITLPDKLWDDYKGRNRHSVRKELRNGDLVWLEAEDPQRGIHSMEDVRSIQWARWGKTGTKFKDQIETTCPHMLPDYLKEDGLVDIVSDLFGSIPLNSEACHAFAARVRFDNLVFANGGTFLNKMPVLAAPHPGCKAFYVKNDDFTDTESFYDRISLANPPRGYKIYRTTKERGNAAPWSYHNQPVFDDYCKEKKFHDVQNMTREKELLQEGETGKLHVTFRGLNKKEFALLLLTLSCDLRLGGGKPLGLGHCIVSKIRACDENGKEFLHYSPERAKLPLEYQNEISPLWFERAELYCKTQEPVDFLRYPRAFKGDDEHKHRGGMCWFSMYAAPKKSETSVTAVGLETLWTTSPLREKAGNEQIRAQGLPTFDPANPRADLLFGYDSEWISVKRPFISDIVKGNENAGGGGRYENTSQNRESRQEERNKR